MDVEGLWVRREIQGKRVCEKGSEHSAVMNSEKALKLDYQMSLASFVSPST